MDGADRRWADAVKIRPFYPTHETVYALMSNLSHQEP